MCSAQAIPTTPQSFYQKANQLGKQAVYAAPRATGAVLTVAPLALYMFQPAGMLTQMLTLAATTGVVLNTPRIYNYVYNHPLTAKVCAQPIVQQISKHPAVRQGTAMVSDAIQTVSTFGSQVKHEVTSRLFPGAISETYDDDDHEVKAAEQHFGEEKKPAKREDIAGKSLLSNQLDTLQQAFKAVPTATAATLAISALALRFFQPEGIITKFATLTLATGAFFTGTKLYGRYHKHPVVKQVSNHPVTQQGAAFVSQVTTKVSNFAQAAKAAYGRAFYPEATVVPQRQEIAPVTPKLPPFPEFRQFVASYGTDNWEGVTFSEVQLRALYTEFPKVFGDVPPTGNMRIVTGRRGSESFVHPTPRDTGRRPTSTDTSTSFRPRRPRSMQGFE